MLKLCAPIAGLVLNALTGIWLARRRNGLLRSLVAGFLAGLAVALFLLLAGDGSASAGSRAAAGLTYLALGYVYFHFVNMGETARRIRLLRELLAAPPGGFTGAELKARYPAREIVRRRLQRLLNNGQVILADGRYRLGPRPVMYWITLVIMAWKRMLFGSGWNGDGTFERLDGEAGNE
ncbi:MAG TPA: hypothetical protein PKN80_04805 [bacterium]|nr:hypothetical protein [bacterium]HNS47970.1 hypothetical protein [bacterium]